MSSPVNFTLNEPDSNFKLSFETFQDLDKKGLIEHAIALRKKKGMHSEFWHKLDGLVDRIKEYKEKTKIEKPRRSIGSSSKRIRMSRKDTASGSHHSSKKIGVDRRYIICFLLKYETKIMLFSLLE